MKAYKRIKKLAEVVDELAKHGDIVADVACDHGYLAELLDRNEKIKTVYASDISEKCLQKVVDLKKGFNLNKVIPVLGDGLKPLPKVDMAVIAGVGGLETIKMLTMQNKLESGENKCNIFILQPAQNVFEFRKWLFDNEIHIICDFVIEDNKRFYPIIAVDVSKKQQNEKSIYNLYFGRDNDKNTDIFERYLKFIIKNFKYINEISKKTLDTDEIIREKCEIYNLAKALLNKKTGG